MGPSPRTVKFVESDKCGLPLKRKQVPQACEDCRKRKKRCTHVEGEREREGEGRGEDGVKRRKTAGRKMAATLVSASSSQGRVPLIIGGDDADASTEDMDEVPVPNGNDDAAQDETAVRPASSRFVGDLNPEGMFAEATPDSAKRASRSGDVGIWLSSGAPNSSAKAPQMVSILDRVLLPIVREECLACVPPDEDFRILRDLYLQKIHPIFPVIPPSTLEGRRSSPDDVVLRQVVCLAAAADPSMTPHLRLENQGAQLLPRQSFSHTLSTSIRATLDTSLIQDKLIHIRCLVLLSLYAQPTSPEEADLPASLSARAVHYVQTMGLHLLRLDPNMRESAGDRDLVVLFCAVWALDRINGAMYGRPCLMHERDVGDKMDEYIRRCPACFRLFLGVVSWLDRVTELYRPGPSEEARGWGKIRFIDLPVLEAMIVEAGALKEPGPLLATIEAFYHAVVILSCRLPRPIPPAISPPASTHPPPSANARRSLAADRIAQGVPRDGLSHAPFVAYAVSLALSVEYQKMRYCQLPMFRARALAQFRSHCRLLEAYGEVFWSARVVSGLGARVIREMERVVVGNCAGVEEGDGGRRGAGVGERDGERERERDGEGLGVGEGVLGDGVGNGEGTLMFDGQQGQGQGLGPGFDMDMSLDVFGQFDPEFNLGAVDDVLESNLDIGLPLNWGDWEQLVG